MKGDSLKPDEDEELLPDRSQPDPNGSESDSGSSEELIPDKKVAGRRPNGRNSLSRLREKSVPRRVRGKQKDPRRKRQEQASSSRDRPNLPIARDDKDDDQDSNESDDSDKTVDYGDDH